MLAASLLVAAWLGGCKDENKLAVPPPPKVSVAHPVQQKVTPYFEGTGNTAAVNQIDLVARVKGFLSAINYQDGAAAKAGETLFVIEQAPYQAQLQQAQASLTIAQAKLVQSQAEFERQQTLLRQNVTAQSTLDQARAKRDSDQGDVTNAQAGVTIAAINLGYTHVAASFDGVVTQHLQSVGALVGADGNTKLATLVQLNPIYATFNVSEQEVLRIRDSRAGARVTQADFGKFPIEIGLMNEEGYPHKGVIQYIAPELELADRHHPGARRVPERRPRTAAGVLRARSGAALERACDRAAGAEQHSRLQPGRAIRAGRQCPGRGGAARREARRGGRQSPGHRVRAQAGRPRDRHGSRARGAGPQGGGDRHDDRGGRSGKRPGHDRQRREVTARSARP